MKALLSVLFLLSAAIHMCKGEALKCHTCVATNEDECNRQGSVTCPQHADACSIITGPNSVMKSCSYKPFCDKALNLSNSGVKLECCFSDNCNGPHSTHSHGGHRSAATTLGSTPALLLGAVIVRLATSAL